MNATEQEALALGFNDASISHVQKNIYTPLSRESRAYEDGFCLYRSVEDELCKMSSAFLEGFRNGFLTYENRPYYSCDFSNDEWKRGYNFALKNKYKSHKRCSNLARALKLCISKNNWSFTFVTNSPIGTESEGF